MNKTKEAIYIVAIAIALIAAMIVMPASAQLADTPWPMFQHDLSHTGLSPYTGPDTPTIKWTYTTGYRVQSSSAIGADGTIYVGSRDDKFYAINPDGTLKWSYPTGGDIYYSSPAIDADGTIYVGSDDDKFYAINPDGTLKWSYLTGGDVRSSPAIGADGTIYVGSKDKKLYAINPDGTLKWSYLTGSMIDYSSPAIGADGTIYVGSKDKKLHAINPDGTLKWSYLTGSYVRCGPAIGADGTIYVGSYDRNLYAINPDGTLKWSYLTGSYVYAPTIGADGTIYIGSNDHKLYAINPDGTFKWSYLTGSYIQSSSAIGADGTIYIGSKDDKLYAINPDGTLKWSYLTGGDVRCSPAIGADGTIYVGSSDYKLYAFGPGPTPEYPDLVITNKSEALEDGTFTVTYTVANVGDGDASASNTTIFIDGTPVMEDPVPALAAGASHTATVGPFDCPCNATTLNITVCADNDNVVEECNEENNCLSNELECQHPLWEEINAELDSLKGNVSNATMPSIIKHRLIDKREYAKALKDNAKIECEAGNFDGATKKLGVAKSQVESFASMVKITRRISPADKASFLADSTEIIGKIDELIEYVETEHKC